MRRRPEASTPDLINAPQYQSAFPNYRAEYQPRPAGLNTRELNPTMAIIPVDHHARLSPSPPVPSMREIPGNYPVVRPTGVESPSAAFEGHRLPLSPDVARELGASNRGFEPVKVGRGFEASLRNEASPLTPYSPRARPFLTRRGAVVMLLSKPTMTCAIRPTTSHSCPTSRP